MNHKDLQSLYSARWSHVRIDELNLTRKRSTVGAVHVVKKKRNTAGVVQTVKDGVMQVRWPCS